MDVFDTYGLVCLFILIACLDHAEAGMDDDAGQMFAADSPET